MTDIEKVVKGLEHCAVRHKCNNKCPYSNIIQDQNEGMDSCVTQLSKDALELLKEQQAEIERLKDDKANVIKLLEKEREENKPGSDYVIRPMRESDINEQHKGMYYAFSFAINALKEKDGETE